MNEGYFEWWLLWINSTLNAGYFEWRLLCEVNFLKGFLKWKTDFDSIKKILLWTKKATFNEGCFQCCFKWILYFIRLLFGKLHFSMFQTEWASVCVYLVLSKRFFHLNLEKKSIISEKVIKSLFSLWQPLLFPTLR